MYNLKILVTLYVLWTRSFVFSYNAPTIEFPTIPEGPPQPCYDDFRKPQFCAPTFEIVSFNKRVEATNTCGEYEPIEFCIQSSTRDTSRSCLMCDARNSSLAHPLWHLTDVHNKDWSTWWQSDTLYEGVEQVNLTLSLGKSYEITYIYLVFQTLRPESMGIYKKMKEDEEWIPFQYFSSVCRDFYGLPDLDSVVGGDETQALCTSEYTDIVPTSGGSVLFRTLHGRPSKENYLHSKELQEFLTATDIKFNLDRLNTYGDDLFGDAKVLRSYFFAISELNVGGRCQCNGHASACVWSSGHEGHGRLVCRCEHNTAGVDCQECLPFYNNKPWHFATPTESHECQACNCNGFSDKCYFDQKLYEKTGEGGHCTDCYYNRDGANCEKCKTNYYQRLDGSGHCIPCYCNEIGSRNMQCNAEGKCQCKPGIIGDKCDRCQANFYAFGQQGCTSCDCNPAGSYLNQPDCNIETGVCHCKDNVETQKCDKCKPSYFNLDLNNDFGCTPCFCYGHSSVCQSAPGYGQVLLESSFSRGNDKWKAEDLIGNPIELQFNAVTQNIEVRAASREPVYFLSPDRYLGDQRGSYNQELNFTLRIGEHGPKPSAEDIIIEGSGLRISRPIFGNPSNALPSIHNQEFTFRIHENPEFGWNPRLSPREFMSILSNLTSIKIRATYVQKGVGFLDNVRMKTARRGSSGPPAPWIEMCTCPEGFIGQFCESCAPGYTHEPKNSGPTGRCVPCSCNGHADFCDPESGHCICHQNHHTTGSSCQLCAKGYYGNSLSGTANDCKECPCPNKGACIQLQDETVVCLECPIGYAGPRCEVCMDGYFGQNDDNGELICRLCECNGNIDENAVGNCNRTSGECNKCIHNTGGPHCEDCLPGFYGDALAIPKGNCLPCECDSFGSIATSDNKFVCEQPTGQCPCKENVMGRQCNQCLDGFYNLASNLGCSECDCDSVGSLNISCGMRSGQCNCRIGVVGLRCQDCAPNHYGFSYDGCKPCDCDPIGSLSLQCDPNGQCPCRENVEGRTCNQCKENKFNRQAGCVDCPACYNLVQQAVNEQRENIAEMDKHLEDIKNAPTVIDDMDFENKLTRVKTRINSLWDEAKSAKGDDKSLVDTVNEIRDKIVMLDIISNDISTSLNQSKMHAEESFHNLSKAEDSVSRSEVLLKNAQNYIDGDGKNALERAQEKALEFHHQSDRLKEMTRQARQLAEDHEREAQHIEDIARSANNISTYAYNLVSDSFKNQLNASEEARNLQKEASSMKDEVISTKQKAQDALKRAQEAYNNSLNQFKDASSIGIPDIALDPIKEQARKAKEDAQKYKDAITELQKAREQLYIDSEEESKQVKELLENAFKQQQMADELLADIDKARNAAEEARNQSDNTFFQAQQIHNTLQGFHQNVENSKVKADEAKGKISEIIDLIHEAESQTIKNQQELNSAKNTASQALNDANDAKTIAEKASTEADMIRVECEETKEKAGNLKDEADLLNTQVADTSSRLTEHERKSEEEDQSLRNALDKASQAKTVTNNAYEKVQNALNSLRSISLALNNIDQINEEGLEGLDVKISEVEMELEKAGLDEKIEALRKARIKQSTWIKNYEEELEFLKKEVENVEAIRNALPFDDKCWKRIRLEP